MFTAEYAEIAEGRKSFRKIINNISLSFPLCPLRPLWYVFREFAQAAQIINYRSTKRLVIASAQAKTFAEIFRVHFIAADVQRKQIESAGIEPFGRRLYVAASGNSAHGLKNFRSFFG